MEQELDFIKGELYNLRNEVYQLRSELNYVKTSNENFESRLANQHVELVQSINAQIMVLNQVSQTLNTLNNRMADVDIRTNYLDDTLKELVDANNGVVQELQEIKTSVDAMKFYALGGNNIHM